MSKVEIVIPTKSYLQGLTGLIQVLKDRPEVEKVTVVADGENAYQMVINSGLSGFELKKVPLGAGIHVMWNLALTQVSSGNHFLMINDDVTINENTVLGLLQTIERYTELGLICPNYDGRNIDGDYFPVEMTCGGNYVGGGGLGGFCMMLSADLVPEWRFDERMKWWYGDDDILTWVRKTKNRVVAICKNSTCADNTSWTLTYDPPANFHAEIENDRLIFIEKWSS